MGTANSLLKRKQSMDFDMYFEGRSVLEDALADSDKLSKEDLVKAIEKAMSYFAVFNCDANLHHISPLTNLFEDRKFREFLDERRMK